MNRDDERTIDQTAQVFRVTPSTVRRWIAEGLPVKHHGRQGRGKKTLISLWAAALWWFKHNHERLELLRAQTRLASERADELAMANAERRDGLAPIPVIEREFKALLAEIRTNALEIVKLAPELEGLDINERKAAIDRVVFEFLDKSAGWRP